MTLTYELDNQFPASYGHDPKTRKISRQKVSTVVKKCGNKRRDVCTSGFVDEVMFA